MSEISIRKVSDYIYEIERTGAMRVPARIYADEEIMNALSNDKSPQQAANVATLPGVVKYSLAMPDIHWGYGFPIGGVAATDPGEGGVISPGGVGYDINCGVRLMRTNLSIQDVRPKLRELVTELFQTIPTGVGAKGAIEKLSVSDQRKLIMKGSQWAVDRGHGNEADVTHAEQGGCLPHADPDKVSEHAMERGLAQVGTLGSGNHFLEVGVVDTIYHPEAARAFGIEEGTVTVLIHCGSRGFGYQICDDYLKVMTRAAEKYKIELPDRQLACAPAESEEGRDYAAAMAAAANYAWANRQVIMHLTRRAFERALGLSPRDLGMRLVYDVCHNMAKYEKHSVNGKERMLWVHRKGATRAFPPGHPDLPADYRSIGQPVLIPGDMGRESYLCVGTKAAMEQTFGSTCHGAGRVLSRSQAIKRSKGRSIKRELEDKNIIVMAHGRATLAEEMPEAYKDVNRVVNVMHSAGISLRVAKLKPVGVIKG
ncbi:MAG: RtcB family protein [Candidatus Abyssobacteria bacterium SURF_17]|uniref:tRNA-splicing ligase RtcB n=1 Tax=Candidatus Abyssobacteria bacterium SURF_17 TaxID=2093361 RepID=A0A419F104_9BACT|nr:MAG: RtcB family protein [Candidatus Abyssubacteria bacterium SURF_17]